MNDATKIRLLRKDLQLALELLANSHCSDCGGPKAGCLWYRERAKLMGWPDDGRRHLEVKNKALERSSK